MIDSKNMRLHEMEATAEARGTRFNEGARSLPGQIVVFRTKRGTVKLGVCRGIELDTLALQVELTWGSFKTLDKVPFTALLERIGPLSEDDDLQEIMHLARIRCRVFFVQKFMGECDGEAVYTLDDMCSRAGVSKQAMPDRLAVALLLLRSPYLFVQYRTLIAAEGQARYALAPDWRERLTRGKSSTQQLILQTVRRRLGVLQDLYRISCNKETGAVTLSFYFPAIAEQTHTEQIDRIGKELGVAVSIATHPHDGALTLAAQAVLPQGLAVFGRPSIYQRDRSVLLYCLGESPKEAVVEAQNRFHEQTGWYLYHETMRGSKLKIQKPSVKEPLVQSEALIFALGVVGKLPGFNRISAVEETGTIILRFYFPLVAMTHYAGQARQIEESTRWNVRFHGNTHIPVLLETARALFPGGAFVRTELVHDELKVRVQCSLALPPDGQQRMQKAFQEGTGWGLEFVNEPLVCRRDLLGVARYLLPIGMTIVKAVTHWEERILSVLCSGRTSDEEQAAVQWRFIEITGWTIALEVLDELQEASLSLNHSRPIESDRTSHETIGIFSRSGEVTFSKEERISTIPQSIYSIPLSVLGLSGKIGKAVLLHQITTVGQLLQMEEGTLRMLMDGDELGLIELCECFQEYGFLTTAA